MRKTVLVLSVLFAGQLSAQVPVVEAGSSGARGNQQAPSNELVVSLYNQLEALQSEVQTLRGLVEEQGYQLQRLQTESRDRYLDVDRRLSAVTQGGFGSAPQLPGLSDTQDLTPAPLNTETPGISTFPAPLPVTPANVVLDEQEQYRTALNLLLEESKYDESIVQFQTYVDAFPQGRLLTNALYWQGEALILVARYDDAIAVFDRLLNEFPQDPKAAGAMLKKGVAYSQKGDRQQAETIWRDLPGRYPDNSPEIKAAQDYLKR